MRRVVSSLVFLWVLAVILFGVVGLLGSAIYFVGARIVRVAAVRPVPFLDVQRWSLVRSVLHVVLGSVGGRWCWVVLRPLSGFAPLMRICSPEQGVLPLLGRCIVFFGATRLPVIGVGVGNPGAVLVRVWCVSEWIDL